MFGYGLLAGLQFWEFLILDATLSLPINFSNKILQIPKNRALGLNSLNWEGNLLNFCRIMYIM